MLLVVVCLCSDPGAVPVCSTCHASVTAQLHLGVHTRRVRMLGGSGRSRPAGFPGAAPRACRAYGMSKFLGGILGAAFSPRAMLAGGLVLTSIINLAFGFTTAVWWWTALWALNGALQVRCQKLGRTEAATAGPGTCSCGACTCPRPCIAPCLRCSCLFPGVAP